MGGMTRLILMVLLVAAMLAVLGLALGPTRPVSDRPTAPTLPRKKEDTMPATLQTIAYVLLIVLMCGVATGWLGAA